MTHGSRGDVQPFVALAHGLEQAGHSATIVVPKQMARLAEQYCSDVRTVNDGVNLLAADPKAVEGLELRFRGLRGKRRLLATVPKTRRLSRLVNDDLATVARQLREEGRWFDVAVHHVSGAGHDIAEYLGVPSLLMCPQPYWVPTSAFPDPSFPWRWHPRLNVTTYGASRAVWWLFTGSTTRWRRRSLGLAARKAGRFHQPDGRPRPVIHAFSEFLLPRPTYYPSWVFNTGFWRLPDVNDWQPSAAFARFLATGTAPVVIGFASTVSSDPRRLAQLVAEASGKAGVRAIVVGGWSGLRADHLSSDVFLTGDVPFDWLFARVQAVVHHGGLGSTADALAAGRPQVVCPHLPDQRFYARRCHALGVCPPPLQQRELTANNLAAAIGRAVADPALRATAHEIGRDIRAEDGVERAVEIIESVAQEATYRDGGRVGSARRFQ